MNHNTETSFKYTYSASEQDEIRKIRQKYQPQEEDKMTTLRKLDAKVTQKAMTVSLIAGILGALVMGTGISLVLTDFGLFFGMNEMVSLTIGVIVGVIGMVPVALAYPIYNKVIKVEREKVAPEILRLTDELMK